MKMQTIYHGFKVNPHHSISGYPKADATIEIDKEMVNERIQKVKQKNEDTERETGRMKKEMKEELMKEISTTTKPWTFILVRKPKFPTFQA